MIRQTSIDAFREINESGLLRKRKLEVYNILYESGPLTGAEVSRIWKQTAGATCHSETVRNRIGELVEMGCCAKVGEVIDKHTNKTVSLFDVTDKLPTKQPKKKTRKEKVDDVLVLLRDLYPSSSEKHKIVSIVNIVKELE